MSDLKESRNRVLYGMLKSEMCLNKASATPVFLNLFGDDHLGKEVAQKSLEWFNKYKKVPDFANHILNSYNKTDPDMGSAVKMRLFELKGIEFKESSFDADVDVLRLDWAKKSLKHELGALANRGIGDIESTDALVSILSDLNKNVSSINNQLQLNEGLPYSYTTKEAGVNIEKLKAIDISKEKRFKIGHRVLDTESNGFKYGEVLMILGNIGQGKSMVLTNMTYNMWRDGANILLLTAEMQPQEFDIRIYSRASAVEARHIEGGKKAMSEADEAALADCIKYMESKPNEIKIRYVTPSDNVGTVSAYMEKLKIDEGFIPDVLIVDSFEHISPLDQKNKDADWMAVGQTMIEFKTLANTFENNRGLFVVSTHQAKTLTLDKKFEDIAVTDFGRSKIVPEKADCCLYIRTLSDLNTMNIKEIKARRWKNNLDWSMGVDYSKAMIREVEQDSINSSSMIDYQPDMNGA
jgi:archaellum biogenesis ATPase FlaH